MQRIQQIQSLARSLPPSPIREPGTPQFADAIQSILSRHFPQAAAASSSSPSASSSSSSSALDSPSPDPAASSTSSNPASSTRGEALTPSQERALEGMLRSLERIQANSALDQFTLSAKTLRPPHDPMVYNRIMTGAFKVQTGHQGRSWWKRFFQVRGKD